MAPSSHDRNKPRRIELKMESHPANLGCARRVIEAFANSCGFDETARGELGLCVNEALANIIRHAYQGAADGSIILVAEAQPDGIRISIRDWGTGVNPQSLPLKPYDPLTPGGLGMVCLRELTDELIYAPQPDGMLLTMVRKKNRIRQQGRRGTREVG